MKWSERYDLHSHTTHSDGSLSVEELALKMASEGVKVWSLTDHDTISGWGEAKDSALAHGIEFVPGVELTCDVELPWDEGMLSQSGRDRTPTSWHFWDRLDRDLLLVSLSRGSLHRTNHSRPLHLR